MGFGQTSLSGVRRGFMPPQLKTKTKTVMGNIHAPFFWQYLLKLATFDLVEININSINASDVNWFPFLHSNERNIDWSKKKSETWPWNKRPDRNKQGEEEHQSLSISKNWWTWLVFFSGSTRHGCDFITVYFCSELHIREHVCIIMRLTTLLRDHPYITSANFRTFSDPSTHPMSA